MPQKRPVSKASGSRGSSPGKPHFRSPTSKMAHPNPCPHKACWEDLGAQPATDSSILHPGMSVQRSLQSLGLPQAHGAGAEAETKTEAGPASGPAAAPCEAAATTRKRMPPSRHRGLQGHANTIPSPRKPLSPATGPLSQLQKAGIRGKAAEKSAGQPSPGHNSPPARSF